MSETKKPLPVYKTSSGESGQLSLGGVRLPGLDSITSQPGVQAVSISSLLLAGEENAVPLRHLVRITGRDEREIRRQIGRERLSGVPILADCRSGYYLPANGMERDRCVKSMRHRAAEIQASARAIEEAQI